MNWVYDRNGTMFVRETCFQYNIYSWIENGERVFCSNFCFIDGSGSWSYLTPDGNATHYRMKMPTSVDAQRACVLHYQKIYAEREAAELEDDLL